jgi:hypothetical protein
MNHGHGPSSGGGSSITGGGFSSGVGSFTGGLSSVGRFLLWRFFLSVMWVCNFAQKSNASAERLSTFRGADPRSILRKGATLRPRTGKVRGFWGPQASDLIRPSF